MTSSMRGPRRARARCSPRTQRTASDTLDLPHPFGPTMAVTPCSKVRVTVSAKDLKPESSSRVSFMRAILRWGCGCAGGGAGRSVVRVLRRHDEGRHADLPAGRLRLLAG